MHHTRINITNKCLLKIYIKQTEFTLQQYENIKSFFLSTLKVPAKIWPTCIKILDGIYWEG
jgi:hypothetical protein